MAIPFASVPGAVKIQQPAILSAAKDLSDTSTRFFATLRMTLLRFYRFPGHLLAGTLLAGGVSAIFSFSSSEFPRSSGAYIAEAFVGRALNLPGISARRR